jgi:hypothetical protein
MLIDAKLSDGQYNPFDLQDYNVYNGYRPDTLIVANDPAMIEKARQLTYSNKIEDGAALFSEPHSKVISRWILPSTTPTTMQKFKVGDKIKCTSYVDSSDSNYLCLDLEEDDVFEVLQYESSDETYNIICRKGSSEGDETWAEADEVHNNFKSISSSSTSPKSTMSNISDKIKKFRLKEPEKSLVKSGLMTLEGVYDQEVVDLWIQQQIAGDAKFIKDTLTPLAKEIIEEEKSCKK